MQRRTNYKKTSFLYLNCFIFDLVSSFIQNTNKEFLKVDQYTTLIKHETYFIFKEAVDDLQTILRAPVAHSIWNTQKFQIPHSCLCCDVIGN